MTVDDRSGAGGQKPGSARSCDIRSANVAPQDDVRRAVVQSERDRAWTEHRSAGQASGGPASGYRQRGERPASETSYGALDLGTNNCRLLIARPAQQGFRVVDAFSRIVRLGEGLGTTGMLCAGAMDRAIEALKICAQKLDLRKVGRTRLVATEACRAASNGAAFIARVADETALDLEIVDQETEAALAVTGCAALADPEADSVIVFDIGGGSTEIIWLSGRGGGSDPAGRIRAWASLPIGVVTMAERFGGVFVSGELFETMVASAGEALAPFKAKAAGACASGAFHLLGTSGTVTTVAGIHLGLDRYDRRQVDGLWMQDCDIGQVMNRLIAMDYHARAANPCIGSERADLVLAGCAIFEAIRRAFPSPRIRIADRGLREGILLKLMHEDGVWRREQS